MEESKNLASLDCLVLVKMTHHALTNDDSGGVKLSSLLPRGLLVPAVCYVNWTLSSAGGSPTSKRLVLLSTELDSELYIL